MGLGREALVQRLGRSQAWLRPAALGQRCGFGRLGGHHLTHAAARGRGQLQQQIQQAVRQLPDLRFAELRARIVQPQAQAVTLVHDHGHGVVGLLAAAHAFQHDACATSL